MLQTHWESMIRRTKSDAEVVEIVDDDLFRPDALIRSNAGIVVESLVRSYSR